MNIFGILEEEIKRLSRLNERLEKEITKGNTQNEPEHKITNNVLAMCEIARILTGQ